MRPSQQLISALRRAADRIEDPCSDFWWGDYTKCNCGFLYNALTGRTPCSKAFNGVWRRDAAVAELRSNDFCEISGTEVGELSEHLMQFGLRRVDIAHIERCASSQVLARMGLDSEANNKDVRGNMMYTMPSFVARYFRAQADILEEQLLQEQNNLRQCGVESRHAGKVGPCNERTETESGRLNVAVQPKAGTGVLEGAATVCCMDRADSRWAAPTAEGSHSPSSAGPLPHSPSPMAALAKLMPCHHNYVMGVCLYCCATKPVEQKEAACS